MRVHRLEVTAFGPFADTQVVDFEPLNAAGVFLLTGQTGAGKTSILDAICFGLYGQVPGVRDRAKTFRSHHAPAGSVPRVVLEVTVQGRRFRLTRSPAWTRPSRRARSGSVQEQARAMAEELIDGCWVARSARADEVGQLISGLLGLNREQFCQVVMLPQGEFQAFLRAGGRDRQRILESLFGTQLFQAVERWLVDHRRRQSRLVRDHEQLLATLVARLQEVSGTSATTSSFDMADLDYPEQAAAVRRLVSSSADLTTELAVAASDAATRSKQARHALDEGRTCAERQDRHRQAGRRQAALIATGDVVLAREERVRRARAAAVLVPLVSLVHDAVEASAEAARGAGGALARVADIPGLDGAQPSATDVAETLSDLGARIAQLGELAHVEAELDRLEAQLEADLAAQTVVSDTVNDLDERIAADPGEIAEHRTAAGELAAIVQRGAEAEDRIRQAKVALTAAHDVRKADAVLAGLHDQHLAARESATIATEAWLTARERYVAGLAARLATELMVGVPCPVCGSTCHPAPATPHDRDVSSATESELLTRVTAARDAVSALGATILQMERARATALAACGGLEIEQAAAALQVEEDHLAKARAAEGHQVTLSAELDRLIRSAELRREERLAAGAELGRLDERIDGCRQHVRAQRSRLHDEIGSGSRVRDLLGRAETAQAAYRSLQSASRQAEEAARAAAGATRRLASALAPSEFDDAASVRSAMLTDAEIAAAEALNRSHAADLTATSRLLTDPVLVEAAAQPVPDLAGLEAEAGRAAEVAAEAAAAWAGAQRRQARLEALSAELDAGVADLLPLREAKLVADDVAGLCTGTSPDNATRTALSHYVLAARLAQVVAAANLRLDAICGGRYQLEHTMTKDAGDSRGGLGLVMCDRHTDRTRDPATLSGGESFYVSLSLALGLADVVTQESGNTELSTLFVDEGFGGLDDDTRDEVLDEIDALRSGGRSIGLVSHLGELRARFPVQLHVTATGHGSSCELATT